MKIVYLIDYDINQTSGVVQKILQQSQKWIESGHTVYFVSTKTLTIFDENKKIIFQQKPLNINLGRLGTAVKLLYSSYFIDKLLKQLDFDILYMRYRLYMPFFTKVLKKYKVVMEINSDDSTEYKLHSLVTHIYNKFTRDLVLKHIDGFVSVSFELKERFNYLQKDIIVIANGIDTLEYTLVNHENKKPTFVFIGTPNQPWHGINKIIQIATHFQEYQFYVIGTDGKESSNIKYFGYLNKEEATKIIQKSDIGIGTLSLYEKGLNEASPLKSRQYLACGLPIIYAYDDTDLNDGNTDFALQLDNHKDNLDYLKIKNFVDFTFNNQVVKEEARLFAENILDYKAKEQERIHFFKKVLDANQKGICFEK